MSTNLRVPGGVQSDGAPERPDCVIATGGLDEREQALLTSMLDLIAGRSHGHWRIGPLANAHVLIFSARADEDLLAQWKARGRPWIALTDANDAPPIATHVLQRPLRVFPLLDVLQEIEQAHGVAGNSAVAKPVPVVLTPRWQLADQLRQLGLGTSHGEWKAAGNVYVSDDGRQFAANGTALAQLRNGSFDPQPLGARCARIPAGLPVHPIAELAWWIGWWSDASSLAPWLDAGMQFRLRHWPDFGLVPVARSTLRLAALAAQRLWTVPRLAAAAMVPDAEVVRFVNAMSVSGLLVTHAAPPRARAAGRGGFVGALLRGLRTKLGLA